MFEAACWVSLTRGQKYARFLLSSLALMISCGQRPVRMDSKRHSRAHVGSKQFFAVSRRGPTSGFPPQPFFPNFVLTPACRIPGTDGSRLHACAAVRTRRRRALVRVLLTKVSLEAWLALAGEAIDWQILVGARLTA